MPGMTGLELLDELTRRACPLPVIMITGHGDVPMAVRAMRAGAMDFFDVITSYSIHYTKLYDIGQRYWFQP